MNKSFKRWTTGAVIAVLLGAWSLWWAGSTSGADGLCSAFGLQPVQDCVNNRDAYPWYMLLTIATAVYLGFYIVRVSRILKSPAARSGPERRDASRASGNADRGPAPGHTMSSSLGAGR